MKLATVKVLNYNVFSAIVLFPPSCCYCLHRYLNNLFKDIFFCSSGVILIMACYRWNFYFSARTMALYW